MDTQKQAGLWDKLKGLWVKWTGTEYRGPSQTEDQVVEAFANDYVRNVLWKRGPLAIRKLVEEANNARLPSTYLPYLFWFWDRGADTWPKMATDAYVALKVAKNIAKASDSLPSYTLALSLPPAELEPNVEKALRNFSDWAAGPMVADLIGEYNAHLKKWAPAMAHAAGAELPKNKAAFYLQALFKNSLERSPTQFLSGKVLHDLVLGLFW